MSDRGEAKGVDGAAAANGLAELWAQLFEQSNQQARAMLDLMKVSGDPMELQRRWLDAVGQSLDGFMRTPAFLEAMGRNLKAMTDLKAMQDRFLQDTARQFGVPMAADVTGLFERLNGAEQAILGRLKAVEARLKAIEGKLGSEVSSGQGS
jgi:hypothetical protein